MKKVFFILVIIVSCIGCNKDLIDDLESIPTPEQRSNVVPLKSAESIATLFYSNFLHKSDNASTRSATEYPKVSPITYKGKQLMWIVNYPNNKGYLMVSAIRNMEPIIGFKEEGNFNCDSLDSFAKSDYDAFLDSYYNKVANLESTTNSLIWDILEKSGKTIADTTYFAEIGFTIPDSCRTNESYNTLQTQTRSGGTIPNRNYKMNYPTMYPLLSFFRQKRDWNIWLPYCYDMPYCMVSGGEITQSGGGPAWLNNLVVCFALTMDYIGAPSIFFWRGQPNVLVKRESTPLSKFIKELSTDMGCSVHYVSGEYLNRDNLFSYIPQVLNSRYYLNIEAPFRYYSDKSGFDRIRNHLYSYNPAIIIPRNTNPYADNAVRSAYVIDGVAELETKVTEKKYFLGILVSSKVYYLYMDYLHYVSPVGRSYDDWKLYDAYSLGNDYVYLVK